MGQNRLFQGFPFPHVVAESLKGAVYRPIAKPWVYYNIRDHSITVRYNQAKVHNENEVLLLCQGIKRVHLSILTLDQNPGTCLDMIHWYKWLRSFYTGLIDRTQR